MKVKWEVCLLSLVCLCLSSGLAKAEYDQATQIFSTAPSSDASATTVARFGPVGMSIDLVKPNFTMRLKGIEADSPASKAEGLKPGQFIHSINGHRPSDIDPRIFLGNIITNAEAADGRVVLMVADTVDGDAEEVVVQIPALGRFSDTWPLDCKKSDRIVRDFAGYLKQPGANKGFADIGMLFLLSTGDPDDLEFVARWARANKGTSRYPWHIGYGGLALCEYYLRTGDQAVLPAIQRLADSAVEQETFGGWAGRGPLAHVTYGGGGGHLNAGGTLVVAYLMLAKECGADIPDESLNRILTHWYRLAGRGCNPYGNGRPETSFVDNGKNGKLAFAMAAAAALTHDGENSIYAQARDAAAMTSFSTTTYRLHGHTGGGIGEIWRSNAMGLLHAKKPKQYRSFMDARRWHYELSRRHDGSFAILGGARYDNQEWGTGYALAFTVPRQTLRLTGAPPTKFSKQYQLPKRPWGTAADDAFVSLESAKAPGGAPLALADETIANDSGKSVITRWNSMGEIPDELILQYAHHPDFLIRRLAARNTVGFKPSYMFSKGGASVRPELIYELLESNDARVRYSIIAALNDGFGNAEVREKGFTPEAFGRLIDIVKDPAESWFVKDAALQLVGRAPADWIVPHVDAIVPYLKHEEWWLQNAAVTALAPVVADERVYEAVLPAVGEFARTCRVFNATGPVRYGTLVNNLQGASPKVAALARETLRETYVHYVELDSPISEVKQKVNTGQRETIVRAIIALPDGYDLLYDIGRKQFPNEALPYASFFLSADPNKFGPELKQAVTEIVRNKLIYEYMGKNRRGLLAEAGATVQATEPRSLKELVSLYQKCGIDDYDWRPFGPDLYNAEWNYFTFDPPEKQAYDASPWRYREVTFPKGMEQWYQPDFDPAGAGWKQGQMPIGQYDGKLRTEGAHCSSPSCRCKNPMRSLWDKEVLLVSGKFKFPKLEPGRLYRIRTGIGQHVGSGDGRRIYVNGRLLFEAKAGNGRRAGGVPRGALITKEFLDEFDKDEVTISVITFLRYGNKAIVQKPPIPQGILSVWVEEMVLPPLDSDSFQKSASIIPMRSSQWQAKQGPDFADVRSEDVMFRFDGNFIANPDLLGEWTAISQVASIEEFDPDKPVRARPWLKEVTFQASGKTDSDTLLWSGDVLMDLNQFQALRLKIKHLAGEDYLFVEAGGFKQNLPPDWKSPIIVMKR